MCSGGGAVVDIQGPVLEFIAADRFIGHLYCVGETTISPMVRMTPRLAGQNTYVAGGSERSGKRARHTSARRCSADEMYVSGRGGSYMMWGDKEIPERREDRDKAL
jgi:hypothetical protein